MISLAQPLDPLVDRDLPLIDIAIPCHPKDFSNLSVVIEGARKNVKNPISKIILITPSSFTNELVKRFPDCTVLADESFLTPVVISTINAIVPLERRGWITQQVIKFLVGLNSDTNATLILDADTVLLSPRAWIDSHGVQVLDISYEFHSPYKKHQLKVIGGESYPLSFVTHYQLMKKESLKNLFGGNGEGILGWINAGDYSENSTISEYDSYGEWMLNNKQEEIRFSKWNNSEVKFGTLANSSYSELSTQYSKFCSISGHSYL